MRCPHFSQNSSQIITAPGEHLLTPSRESCPVCVKWPSIPWPSCALGGTQQLDEHRPSAASHHMKEQLAWGMRWWLHLQKGSQTQQFIRIIFFQHAYCSKYRAEGKGSHGPACILNTPPSMVFKAASSRQAFPEMLLFSVLVTIMVHFIVSQSAADIWQLKEMHSFSRGFCISGPNQSIS